MTRQMGRYDWAAERRWTDRTWAGMLLVGLVLVALMGVGWAIGGSDFLDVALVPGLVVIVAAAICVPLQQRSTARKFGVAPADAGAVQRRIRSGRVPDDPEARRAMAAVVSGQREAMLRGRRALPYWVAALVVLGVLSVVLVKLLLGVLLLAFAAAMLAAVPLHRRAMRRVEATVSRLEKADGPA